MCCVVFCIKRFFFSSTTNAIGKFETKVSTVLAQNGETFVMSVMFTEKKSWYVFVLKFKSLKKGFFWCLARQNNKEAKTSETKKKIFFVLFHFWPSKQFDFCYKKILNSGRESKFV